MSEVTTADMDYLEQRLSVLEIDSDDILARLEYLEKRVKELG